MIAVKAYYDGNAFVPLNPVKAKLNQSAIITILDDVEAGLPKPFEKYVGKLSNTDYVEITEALLETQKVDANEW